MLTIWHIIASQPDVNSVLLPTPQEVSEAAIEMTVQGVLVEDLVVSIKRVTIGFLFASVCGIVLGALLSASTWISGLLYPVLELIRPIPPIAWIPLAILWFGIGDTPSYFIVSIGAFFPVFLSTYDAIAGVDRRFIDAARCMGASKRMLIMKVTLPAALPSILTGLRIGLGVAWMAVVAAELVSARSGLGYMIQLNRSLLETARVIIGMIVIGMVGATMTTVLYRIQKILVPWQ
ncbi:MAG: ABC transporter permease [Chloroflexales bacterium]|nr:ABC transporter permease [Chloroflexales bacterium]